MNQIALNLECSREVLAALRKEYVPTIRVKELVAWLLDDPLLSGDQESDDRLLLSFNKYWSDKEHRWIIPTNESRKRIMDTALKGLRAKTS